MEPLKKAREKPTIPTLFFLDKDTHTYRLLITETINEKNILPNIVAPIVLLKFAALIKGSSNYYIILI